MARAHGDLHARVSLREALEDRRQGIGRDDRRRAHGDVARDSAPELRQNVAPVGHGLERTLGIGKKGAPRLRQAHAAAPADEQRDADVLLERVQTRGQRGLRHEERVRCLGDRPAPHRLHERLQLRMHR